MKYNKLLISLYKQNINLPQKFIELEVKLDVVYIKVKQSLFENGFLMIYDGKKCYYKYVSSDNKIFKLKLNLKSSLFFCYRGEFCYYGSNKEGSIGTELIDFFDNTYKEILFRLNKGKTFDEVDFCEHLIQKLFHEKNIDYYLFVEQEIRSMFLIGRKLEEVERRINDSRFVIVGDKNCEMCFGVVYKEKSPYAIAIGTKIESNDSFGCDFLIDYHYYEVNGGFWQIRFIKASDGTVL